MSNGLTWTNITALEAPLPLEAGHEVRVDEVKTSRNGSTYARWLVYTTEQPVADRLSEVDPSWSLRHVDTTVTETTANVTVELTIKGVTRAGTGSAPLKRGTKDNPHAIKAAATDAFKRAARLFGVGAYLLNAPRIRTDYAKDASWDDKQRWEAEANAKFTQWFKRQFATALSASENIAGHDRAAPDTPDERAAQALARGADDLGKTFRNSDAPFDGAICEAMAHYMVDTGMADNINHAANRIKKVLSADLYQSYIDNGGDPEAWGELAWIDIYLAEYITTRVWRLVCEYVANRAERAQEG